MTLSTSQFPVIHRSDEGSGRPALPMLWNSHPSHLLINLLGTRNIRVWRQRTNLCWSNVGWPQLLPRWLSPGVEGSNPSAVPGVQETRWVALAQTDWLRAVSLRRILATHMCAGRTHGSAEGSAARQVGGHTQSCASWRAESTQATRKEFRP